MIAKGGEEWKGCALILGNNMGRKTYAYCFE
jgi:hypothetical protein